MITHLITASDIWALLKYGKLTIESNNHQIELCVNRGYVKNLEILLSMFEHMDTVEHLKKNHLLNDGFCLIGDYREK